MDVRLTTVDSTRFLTNPYDTYVSKSLEVYGEWSYGEVELLSKLLGPESNVVEVGANIGAHTVFIARDICPSGLVYAFEPRRLLFQMLCANVALNGLGNVHALQKAAGSKKDIILEGSMPTNQPSNQGGYPLGTIPGDSECIEVIVVDEMLSALRPISLLKVDAEGFELDVLIGSQNLIKRDKPCLYLENDRLEKSSDLIKFVMGMNYDLWWHIVHLFRKDNRARTAVNIFGNVCSFNMLCLPKDRNLKVAGLQKIDDPDAHPLRTT